MLLFIIISLGLVFRIVRIADVPPGINRDEAAIGYTAYSLLKTGRDEHGHRWPISLKSFGDWKLPLYVYSTIPSIAVFGVTEFAVRFPSVITGLLTVLISYLIGCELFKRKEIGLVTSALMAISPWHIFFSRVASEANLAVFLVTASFYLIIKSQKKLAYLSIGTFLLSLTLLAYHGNHIFTPLIFIAFVYFFRIQFFTKIGFLSIGIFVIIATFVYWQTLLSADKTKISGLFALNDPSLVHEGIVKNRLIFGESVFGKLFYNKGVFFC
jgi:4-amino-4-deoxy-L-arabinose transferase-like glycosyltransferase